MSNNIIILLILIYILSLILSYYYMYLAHSKGGRWENMEPTNKDFLVTVLPIANTLTALVGWIGHYPIKRKSPKINLSKFFNIKK